MQNSHIKNLQEQIFQLREKVSRLTRFILEADGEQQSGAGQQGGSQGGSGNQTPAQKPLPTPKIVPVSPSPQQPSSATSSRTGPRKKNPGANRVTSAGSGASQQSSQSQSGTRTVRRRGGR